MLTSVQFHVILFASVFTTEAKLNMTEVCPFNTFCKSGPLKNWTPDGKSRPCCENCLCTEDCELFGKCCHDFESKNNTQTQIHDCYTQNELYNHPRNLSVGDFQEGFVIITSCPDNYQGHVTCLEMQELDDYIPVSRKSDGRIYVNRKCAQCNGVKHVVEWTLNIIALHSIVMDTITSKDHFQRKVLKSCGLYSTPPTSLYAKILKYECVGSRTREKICDARNAFNTATIEIHMEKCDSSNEFPYIYMDVLRGTTIYNNPYCLFCFENTRYNPSMCMDRTVAIQPKRVRFTMVLSTRVQMRIKPKCQRGEIFDPSEKSCKNLNCPTFHLPDFGVCRAFVDAMPNFGMMLGFSATTNGNILNLNQFGMLLARFVRSHLHFDDPEHKDKIKNPCKLQFFKVFEHPAHPKIIWFLLSVITNKKCSVYNVLNDAKKFKELVTSRNFTLSIVNTNISDMTSLQSTNVNGMKPLYRQDGYLTPFEPFFVSESILEECPYVEINVEQHPLQEKFVKYTDNDFTDGNHSTMKICVDDYMTLISTTCQCAISTLVYFICVCLSTNHMI